jgi:hypothetical protein
MSVRHALSLAELETERLFDLPERSMLALVNANIAAPINLAAALNVLADGATAMANAAQTAPVNQGM